MGNLEAGRQLYESRHANRGQPDDQPPDSTPLDSLEDLDQLDGDHDTRTRGSASHERGRELFRDRRNRRGDQ